MNHFDSVSKLIPQSEKIDIHEKPYYDIEENISQVCHSIIANSGIQEVIDMLDKKFDEELDNPRDDDKYHMLM